jgi:hypothetical protein
MRSLVTSIQRSALFRSALVPGIISTLSLRGGGRGSRKCVSAGVIRGLMRLSRVNPEYQRSVKQELPAAASKCCEGSSTPQLYRGRTLSQAKLG